MDDHEPRHVLALVDVLRDEWACQAFQVNGGPPRPLGEPERLHRDAVARRAAQRAEEGPVWLVGFGLAVFEAALGASAVQLYEPAFLAASAAREATLRPPAWDPKRLTAPLYFRPPAVTLPKKKPKT